MPNPSCPTPEEGESDSLCDSPSSLQATLPPLSWFTSPLQIADINVATPGTLLKNLVAIQSQNLPELSPNLDLATSPQEQQAGDTDDLRLRLSPIFSQNKEDGAGERQSTSKITQPWSYDQIQQQPNDGAVTVAGHTEYRISASAGSGCPRANSITGITSSGEKHQLSACANSGLPFQSYVKAPVTTSVPRFWRPHMKLDDESRLNSGTSAADHRVSSTPTEHSHPAVMTQQPTNVLNKTVHVSHAKVKDSNPIPLQAPVPSVPSRVSAQSTKQSHNNAEKLFNKNPANVPDYMTEENCRHSPPNTLPNQGHPPFHAVSRRPDMPASMFGPMHGASPAWYHPDFHPHFPWSMSYPDRFTPPYMAAPEMFLQSPESQFWGYGMMPAYGPSFSPSWNFGPYAMRPPYMMEPSALHFPHSLHPRMPAPMNQHPLNQLPVGHALPPNVMGQHAVSEDRPESVSSSKIQAPVQNPKQKSSMMAHEPLASSVKEASSSPTAASSMASSVVSVCVESNPTRSNVMSQGQNAFVTSKPVKNKDFISRKHGGVVTKRGTPSRPKGYVNPFRKAGNTPKLLTKQKVEESVVKRPELKFKTVTMNYENVKVSHGTVVNQSGSTSVYSFVDSQPSIALQTVPSVFVMNGGQMIVSSRHTQGKSDPEINGQVVSGNVSPIKSRERSDSASNQAEVIRQPADSTTPSADTSSSGSSELIHRAPPEVSTVASKPPIGVTSNSVNAIIVPSRAIQTTAATAVVRPVLSNITSAPQLQPNAGNNIKNQDKHKKGYSNLEKENVPGAYHKSLPQLLTGPRSSHPMAFPSNSTSVREPTAATGRKILRVLKPKPISGLNVLGNQTSLPGSDHSSLDIRPQNDYGTKLFLQGNSDMIKSHNAYIAHMQSVFPVSVYHDAPAGKLPIPKQQSRGQKRSVRDTENTLGFEGMTYAQSDSYPVAKKTRYQWRIDHLFSFNSLAPGRSWCDFKNVIFNLALLIGIFKSSYDNVLRWMPQNLTYDKSILVQVMAWCRQATSHYLDQCWPRSPMPYGVTRPQWVNTILASLGCRIDIMGFVDMALSCLDM